MCAYNRVDGVAGLRQHAICSRRSCASEWGFQGYVVSDCGAIGDIFADTSTCRDAAEAAAVAVKTGTDLTCGNEYRALVDAVKAAQIKEAEVDVSLERLFVARFKLGMFDPPERVPFSKIPYSETDSVAHRELALEAARKSIVLLKNENRTLPLKPSVQKIAVIGPSADDPESLLGNYNGFSSRQVAPLQGIQNQFAKASVRFALGANYTAQSQAPIPSDALTPPNGSGHGLLAEYFDNASLQGQPKLQRVEPRPYVQAGIVDPAVAAAIPPRGYSARWTGTLKAPVSGDYIPLPEAGVSFWTTRSWPLLSLLDGVLSPLPCTPNSKPAILTNCASNTEPREPQAH